MKKKILSTLLAATLAMSSLPMAFAADGDVEIGFKVGDSTLMINGQAQTVETPYVVGEGVTLVPLRVITEAFGAEVIWEGETKSITLKYPDVEILLQIDNPTAEVNGIAQTLLSAPELTPNGVTMVPLRFISETFGAEVSYDEATGGIKVVKSKTAANDTVGIIDNTYIGDDYYGWSMENFKDATSTDRDFDGMSTLFRVDSKTAISVDIYMLDDDYDFEKSFQGMKTYANGSTLTRADKDNEKKTAVVQFKDSEGYADLRLFLTDKYAFQVWGVSGDADMSKKVSAIMDTFQTTYRTSDIHNLSEVEGTMRKYKSDMFKYSIKVPADFYETSSSSENDVTFFSNKDNDESRVSVTVFSKGEKSVLTAAEESLARDTANLNPNIIKFSPIETMAFGENTFTGYRYEVEEAFTGDETCIDVFMEKGDYIYEVVVNINTSRNDKDTAVAAVLSSLTTELLDTNEIGTILLDRADAEGTYTEKGSNFEVTVPLTYRTSIVSSTVGESLIFTSEKNGASVMVTGIKDSNVSSINLTAFLKEAQAEDGKVIQHPSAERIGDKSFTTMIEYITNEETNQALYRKTYVYRTGDLLYLMTAIVDEIYYTDAALAEFDAIAESLAVKK